MTPEERAKKIKMIIMDVDGTLTDGSLLLLPDGEEIKSYNVKDGLGILLAHLAGIRTGIITGKISKPLKHRADRLKMLELHQGALDKKKPLIEIIEKNGFDLDQVAFIGDDLGDLEVMKMVGFSGAVRDAHPKIIENSHWICEKPGGKGAVREFIEFILTAQNLWPKVEKKITEINTVKDIS